MILILQCIHIRILILVQVFNVGEKKCSIMPFYEL